MGASAEGLNVYCGLLCISTAYLKRFHLSDSDYCSCGIGTGLHCATECIYTVSWHMRKPAPNFEQEWLKRVANNLVSRQKMRGIIKFISENRDLFGLWPSTSQQAGLSGSITSGHSPSNKKGDFNSLRRRDYYRTNSVKVKCRAVH
ncbi:hypothetical protein AVEN_132370-1 [Araneus ventricosus]|uniref:Uncharacterized protein n=1 Tax=Araneus ventricosus TaxID=182803 RepID=A0A4Y2NEQ7_ARAVE|nr:hypothetical protein AVEN_132370-1 [Araneus ventricosus]